MIFRNCCSALSMPAAVPQRHLARAPALHVPLGAADDLDHRLARVGALERAPERAGDTEPGERQRLLHPFPERARGAGIRAVELARERSQLLKRPWVVVERPRPPQPLPHASPVAFGQMVDHVALLVPETTLDGRLAEDVADRLPERVDPEQDPLLG